MIRYVFAVIFVVALSGCETLQMTGTGGAAYKSAKPGPPAHAPAHGRRRKDARIYRYYPSASVYFDIGRKLYFYLGSDGWKASATLSAGLKLSLGDFVSLELNTEKPYLMHSEHRKKYPPGQLKKKKGKAKGNKWR